MPGVLLNIFTTFFRLGCTSFGGPAAHLGFFRTEFVERKKWLSDDDYSELVAVSQFLPGPASSQVGMAIGALRGGLLGGVLAWLAFTAPSAIIMLAAALGIAAIDLDHLTPIIHALKLVAVAVVAHAVWGMAKNLCTGLWKTTTMIAMATLSLLATGPFITVAGLAVAAAIAIIATARRTPPATTTPPTPKAPFAVKKLWPLAIFATGLIGFPLLHQIAPGTVTYFTDVYYRTGALVFGGGHVVLPMLHNEVVSKDTVTADDFLAGYALAQALPGPLFAFAAYVGAIAPGGLPPIVAGLIALIAVFLPGALLLGGLWPLWTQLKHNRYAKAAMAAVNAAVVGVLLAVLYDPLFATTVTSAADFAAVLILACALMVWRLPPWVVVLGAAALGWGSAALLA